jgi:signal transduction histidine kinase
MVLAEPDAPAPPVVRTRVLLVEDDPGDAALVRALLNERPGFEVLVRPRLSDALDTLETVADVDVALLDLSLPDSDGLDTVHRWRARARDLPVVVLTGHDDEVSAHMALAAGAQDYVVKGAFDRPALVRAMVHARDRHEVLSDLEQHRDELARVVALKDEILATATHELRSPLEVLRGVAQTLDREGGQATEEQRHRLLDAVERQSCRLQALVEDLLDLARQEAVAPPRLEVVGLRRLVGAAVADAGDDVRRAVTVEAEDLEVLTEESHLRRILLNLLDNAGKYGAGPIEVQARREGTDLRLSVRDHGSGVPEDIATCLFEPFTRTAVDRRSSTVGTGLGLAIVDRLARRLQGSVTYEGPRPGAPGATFVVRVPLGDGRPR